LFRRNNKYPIVEERKKIPFRKKPFSFFELFGIVSLYRHQQPVMSDCLLRLCQRNSPQNGRRKRRAEKKESFVICCPETRRHSPPFSTLDELLQKFIKGAENNAN